MPNTPLAYFDRMYEEHDPWGYESRWYEHRKYTLTLGALAKERYDRGFEPGCSIGVLTAELAGRCEHLLAADFHPGVLDQARRRLADRPHVEIAELQIPDGWPAGRFDL